MAGEGKRRRAGKNPVNIGKYTENRNANRYPRRDYNGNYNEAGYYPENYRNAYNYANNRYTRENPQGNRRSDGVYGRQGNGKRTDAQNGYANGGYGPDGLRQGTNGGGQGNGGRANPRNGYVNGGYGPDRPRQGTNGGGQGNSGRANPRNGYVNGGYTPQGNRRNPDKTERAGNSQEKRKDKNTGRREIKFWPGIRKYVTTAPLSKGIVIFSAALIITVAIMIFVLVRCSRVDGSLDKTPEAKEFGTETVIAETEPEPDVPSFPHPYAVRTDDTVKMEDEILCTKGILIDLESNTVIADKDGDGKMFPASMTKVLTVLTAIDYCENLDDTFTVPYEVLEPLGPANASVAGFEAGETVTVRDLFYGVILPSGADATGCLAIYVAGSESAFAALMNKKCEELGITNSHFVTASGLHNDNHYSTCHDIALIFENAMDNEFLREVLGTWEYVTSETEQHPEGITLQSTMYSRIQGSDEFDRKISVIAGKTGYTDEAGNCLVSIAEVSSTGKQYLFVCGGGMSKWKPVFDTIHIYRKYLGVHYDGEYTPPGQIDEDDDTVY